MPESVNYWMPISGPAGQLFHADLQAELTVRDRCPLAGVDRQHGDHLRHEEV
jgi:hypothetical protein